MKGELLIACLVAFAVLPNAAQGSPELTYPTGTRLATGTTIRGVNVGSVKMTSTSGMLMGECTSASITATLGKNDGTSVEATVVSAKFSGGGGGEKCSKGNFELMTMDIENGMPWCLIATEKMKAAEFWIRGNSCSKEARPIALYSRDRS